MISPSAPPSKPVRSRPSWTRLSANPDVRSVQIAVVATILVHLLLLWWAPRVEGILEARTDLSSSGNDVKSFDFEWVPEPMPFPVKPVEKQPTPLIPPDPPPEKKPTPQPTSDLSTLVDTNPNAPDNVPDKTQNTTRMNQQVAQEKPSLNDSRSEIPMVKGTDKDAMGIVDGESYIDRFKSTSSEYQPEVLAVPAARRAETPLSGQEQASGEDASAVGSNDAKSGINPSNATEKVEGLPGADNKEGPAEGLYFKVDPQRPMPRKTLSPSVVSQAKPAVLIQNEYGTATIGITASNSKWSQFGDYIDKLSDTIGAQCEKVFTQTNLIPPPGTKVVVFFKLNAQGEVTEIIKVTSDAGLSTKAACVSAVVDRAPYGKWHKEMTDTLGKDIVVEFTFSFL